MMGILVIPLLLLALGFPVFMVFLATATGFVILTAPSQLMVVHQTLFGGFDNYVLLAVPFFVFAGELMSRSGIAGRIINLVLALTGRLPGSLGVATVGASTVLGTISGSSMAAVGALGGTMYPRLHAAGYGEKRAVGLLASSGAIDIVIPPSIAMILYGLAAEQSIARLFIAGILPGLLIAGAMIVFIASIAQRDGITSDTRFDARLVVQTSKDAIWALLMPIFVIGGIYGGAFSPTEAGGFACLYAMLVARLVYRSMSVSDIVEAAADAALLSAKILIIVSCAGVLVWLLTTQGIPQSLSAAVEAMNLSAVEFLLVVNLLLLLVGCFLDPTSAILVLAPLLVPLAVSLGIDPIHFGVVMTVNLAIGMFTPPFGMNLFAAQSVTGLPAHTIYAGVLPFAGLQLVTLALITYLPALSLTLGA